MTPTVPVTERAATAPYYRGQLPDCGSINKHHEPASARTTPFFRKIAAIPTGVRRSRRSPLPPCYDFINASVFKLPVSCPRIFAYNEQSEFAPPRRHVKVQIKRGRRDKGKSRQISRRLVRSDWVKVLGIFTVLISWEE